MWSMPLMRPLAIDGAAPSTTTNRIAASVSLNSRIASGNQAIDGMVCSPVISEPNAARSTRTARHERAEHGPDHEREREADDGPAQRGAPTAGHERRRSRSTSSSNTVAGPGSTYSGFQPLHTTSCQMNSAMRDGAPASATAPTTAAREPAAASASAPARARRGRPAPRRAAGCGRLCESNSAMAAHLLPQPVGDRGGQLGDLGRVDAAGPVDVDRELVDHPAGPARQQHDAVAEADRLADVVGDEQHGEAALAPDPLELVVEQVAGHGVERAEGLVHQQDVGLLGERPGQRDPLAHAAGQLVGPLASPKPLEVHEVEQLGRPAACARRCAARRAAGAPARRCPRTVSHGNSAASWNIRVVRPPRTRRVPGRRAVEAGDEVEQRGLAAAGGADEADELARLRRRATTGRAPAPRCRPLAVDLGDGVERDGRRASRPSERRGLRRRTRRGVSAAARRSCHVTSLSPAARRWPSAPR